MQSTKVVDIETERILKEAENIYGFEKGIEVLRNYASYINMRKNGYIDFGTYNILIRNYSSYDFSEKVVESIWKLLKNENIIETSYKYLSREELRKRHSSNTFTEIERLQEQLLIIDTKKLDISIYRIISDVKEMMEFFPEKIFIIVDADMIKGQINADLGDLITWNFQIERISKDEKIDFIERFIASNNISVDKDCSFVDKLSEEPFWKVKEELYNVVLKLKMNNIELITDKVVKDNLKKEYYDKNKKVTNTKKTGSKELNDLIGMEEVKTQVNQIVNYIKVNKKRGNMPSLHMCFRGNPGTGKTTVARIIGKIFNEKEILSKKGAFVEAQRSDLVGEFVGHTAPKTKRVVDKAKGGILFIDEAYNLNPRGSDKDYGYECISTLIKEMEDNRDNLCVILAGYTDEMEDMLKVNPGFESRIQFKVDFPDYSAEELYQIFRKMAKNENYKLATNLKGILVEIFEKEKKKENFSNARFVRNLFEKVKFEQADRVTNNKEEDINLIKKIDIQNVMGKIEDKEVVRNRIGFAC